MLKFPLMLMVRADIRKFSTWCDSVKSSDSLKTRAAATLLTLAGVLGAGSASADADFTLSGFGTLGATYSNSRETDFVGSLYQPNGPGRSAPVMFGVDTKAGVQGAFTLDNGLSGVLQVVSDHRADNTYSPEVEWASLKYQIADTYVRAGRVVAPVFMVSVYRDVGYAQIPVRQSWDVYSLNPIKHLDGVDVGTKFAVAEGTLSGQLALGRIKETLVPASFTGKGALGNLSYELASSTFRVGYGKYKLDFTVTDPAFPADLYMEVINSGIASQYLGYATPNAKLSDVGLSMWSLGYLYDPGDWFAQGEYVRRKGEGTLVQSVAAWYVLAGYRFGQFKPYVSYANMRSIQSPLNPPARAPYSCAGFSLGADLLCDVTYLINTVDTVSNQRIIQSTVSLGVRYDVFDKMALKLQYDRISKPGDSGSQTIGQFPVTPPGGWSNDWVYNPKKVNLLSATLDFVF